MAIVTYGSVEQVIRTIEIKSENVLHKQKAQDKLDEANRKVNRRLDKANITKPTDPSEGFDYLGDITNKWAACLFLMERHGLARTGRSKGFLQSSNVLCDEAKAELEYWLISELDIGTDLPAKFDWERIEGEGIKEEV